MATERQREYELVVVLTPEAGEAEAAVSVDRLAEFIAGRGGTVSVRESWGVRRLAYPIQNYREGNYFLMRFEMGAGETRELDQTLQASQDVLRHLVTIAEGPRPEPVEEKAEAAAESGETPAEEAAAAEADSSASAPDESTSAEAGAGPAATEEAPSAEAEAASTEAEESAEEAVASTVPEAQDEPAEQQERPA